MWLVWIIAYLVVRNDYVMPSFGDALKEMGRLLTEAAFWRAFGNTLLRTFWAFSASFVLGAGLALVAKLHTAVRAFFAPVVSVLRTVPTMAIILMLLLWTNPKVAPVIVALLVLFPAFYAAALAGLDGVEDRYGTLVRAFGVGAGRKLIGMYLPLAAPPVLKQAGSVFSLGLKITISGEVLSSTFRSLGGLMQEAKMYLQMPRLMALTLVSVLLGFALEGLCALLCRLIVRWRA